VKRCFEWHFPVRRRNTTRLDFLRKLRCTTHDGVIILYLAMFVVAGIAILYAAQAVSRQPWFAREHISVVTVDDKVYVLGGSSRVGDEGLLDEVLELDPIKATVRLAARLPWRTYSPPSTSLNGDLFVLGGYAYGSGDYQDDILRIEPSSGTITAVGKLPTARALSGAVSIDGLIYIVGGWDGANTIDEIVEFDPETGSTRIIGWLPSGRQGHSVLAHGGLLYAFGGEDEQGDKLDEILEIDPASGDILRIGHLPSPRSRTAAYVVNDDIIVMGGVGRTLLDEIVGLDLHASDIVSEVVGRLSEASADLSFATIDERLFQLGGPAVRKDQDRQIIVREIPPDAWQVPAVLQRIRFRGSR